MKNGWDFGEKISTIKNNVLLDIERVRNLGIIISLWKSFFVKNEYEGMISESKHH